MYCIKFFKWSVVTHFQRCVISADSIYGMQSCDQMFQAQRSMQIFDEVQVLIRPKKKKKKNNIPCINKESQYLITRNTLSVFSDYFGKHYSVTTGQQKKAFYQSRCLLCIHVIGWVKGQMLLVCTTLEYKDNSHCVSSRRIKFLKGIVPSVCLLIPCSARKLT